MFVPPARNVLKCGLPAFGVGHRNRDWNTGGCMSAGAKLASQWECCDWVQREVFNPGGRKQLSQWPREASIILRVPINLWQIALMKKHYLLALDKCNPCPHFSKWSLYFDVWPDICMQTDYHVSEKLIPECQVFFRSRLVKKFPCDLRHPLQDNILTGQIQFFPFRRGMRAAMKSSNTYWDGLRRIVLHLSHFILTWAGGWGGWGCWAGSHRAGHHETGYSRVSKNSPASVCHTTTGCTLSIRRGCRSQFSGRDGICFIFTRTPSPCQAVQGVITERWYQERSRVLRISRHTQTDNHEWTVSSTVVVKKSLLICLFGNSHICSKSR